MSVLLNANVELGEVLSSFKAFTMDFPPDLKGEAIGSCVPVREAHNSFARPEPFEMESKEAKEDDDVFHFISYIPFDGAVYELDGLKQGPIKLATVVPGVSWVKSVGTIINERIQRYAASEIRFNLLEVTQDMRPKWEARITELEKVVAGDKMDVGKEEEDPAQELEQLKLLLAQENEKFTEWRNENIRRRHNYVPFIMNLLKVLGERQQLTPLLKQAEAKERERKAAQKK